MPSNITNNDEPRKAAYTPGPWDFDLGDFSIYALDSSGGAIPLYQIHDDGADGMTIERERDANSCLISASPDLLEALKPFAEFARIYLAVADKKLGNYPTKGAIYTMETKDGKAELTVEAFRAAIDAIAKAIGQ